MILQLDPILPLETSRGRGFAFAMIDYSQEHTTIFKVIVTATGEIWDVPQNEVRGCVNWTMGRGRGTDVEKRPVGRVRE